jgi:hypothetical protein
VPVWPPLEAEIVAVPTVIAVTTPVDETVATFGLPELHVTVRPPRTLPTESLSVAVSCTVFPVVTLAVEGDTVTDATDAGEAATTVRFANPLFPPALAEMTAEPTATADSKPLADTVATLVFDDDHVTA